jgi:hypothetical protein
VNKVAMQLRKKRGIGQVVIFLSGIIQRLLLMLRLKLQNDGYMHTMLQLLRRQRNISRRVFGRKRFLPNNRAIAS